MGRGSIRYLELRELAYAPVLGDSKRAECKVLLTETEILVGRADVFHDCRYAREFRFNSLAVSGVVDGKTVERDIWSERRTASWVPSGEKACLVEVARKH